MIERLIAFKTVSHDSNLGLIEWVRDYLGKFITGQICSL
jgi:acetylornithine deacetylase